MKPLYTKAEIDSSLNLKFIDILKLANSNLKLTKVRKKSIKSKNQQSIHYKYRANWLENSPNKQFFDYIEKLRLHVIELYEKERIVLGAGSKFEEQILISLKKYNKLDVSNTLIEQNGKKLLYNFNKFGSVINHWFPEMVDTKICYGNRQKARSIIDGFKDKKEFHRLMVMFLLEDRMHLWTVRDKIKTRTYDVYIPETMFQDKKESYIFPAITHAFRLGLRTQPAGQFPTAISKFLIKDAINKTYKDDGKSPLIMFDPCCGWGGRFISMLANSDLVTKQDIYCIINDVNEQVHQRFFGIFDYWQTNIERIDNFKFNKTLIPIEDINEYYDSIFNDIKGKVNFAITSPPYYNKEIYNENNPLQSHNRYNNYEEWKIGFLASLLKRTHQLLKKGGIFYLNIANIEKCNIQKDAIEYSKKMGFKLLDTYHMILTIGRGTDSNKNPIIKNNNQIECKGKLYKSEPIFLLKKV